MTAICAVVSDGKVWMGGDSAGVAGLSLSVRSDVKVFVNGPYVMGFTTSFRMGQLLHWAFSPPSRPEGVGDEHFMTTTFVDAVRDCLKAGGYAAKYYETERGGNFLVGYRGKIWEVEGDYQVGLHADYAAVGCGWELCLGSLFTSADYEYKTPTSRLVKALEAAAKHSAGVRGPFVIEVEP